MRIKGIDVSGYNPIRDYALAAADGVEFAIIKIIRKDLQPDKLFETHWTGFERVGVPIQGVYNYTYATTVDMARSAAQRVIEVLSGRKTMVWLDIEYSGLAGKGQELIDIINTYAAVIQNAGLQFGIYTYLAFYNANMRKYADQLQQYPFWVARYPSTQPMDNNEDPDLNKCPDVGQHLYGWQYSSSGVVQGIPGRVDLDEWYVDIEAQDVATPVTDYITEGFAREMATALGLPADSIREEILSATVTISTSKNRYHAAVTPLERLLKEHGYYAGAIEAEQGKTPIFGSGMAKATALYQAAQVELKRPDREWTAGNRSYRTALQIG